MSFRRASSEGEQFLPSSDFSLLLTKSLIRDSFLEVPFSSLRWRAFNATSVLKRPVTEMSVRAVSSHQSDANCFEVLRFLRAVSFNPPRTGRTNEDVSTEMIPVVLDASAEVVRAVLVASAEDVHEVSDISFEVVRAVKGDALIHGPYLAARPVGSDWRTRRPRQLTKTIK